VKVKVKKKMAINPKLLSVSCRCRESQEEPSVSIILSTTTPHTNQRQQPHPNYHPLLEGISMMSTNDLRSNDLEKEFSRIETHARAKFEHEEFLHSAQHWKNCSSIAKELRRDDLRALAYRHLSFALRGCGQNTQADEAYRRAMKYETRAAPTSPNNNSSNNIRVPPSIAASSTESPRGTVKLLQSSINHHTHHHQDIDHHHVLLDTKVEQRDYLTGEEYEQGLQSLAEANARLRDQLETLQQQQYVVFHKEANTMGGGGYIEYALIKLGKRFFDE
jgi:hypothetical protein